jgi:hypothetical protein
MSRDSLFFERGAGYNECRLETIDLIPPDAHSKNADCQVANLAAVTSSSFGGSDYGPNTANNENTRLSSVAAGNMEGQDPNGTLRL